VQIKVQIHSEQQLRVLDRKTGKQVSTLHDGVWCDVGCDVWCMMCGV